MLDNASVCISGVGLHGIEDVWSGDIEHLDRIAWLARRLVVWTRADGRKLPPYVTVNWWYTGTGSNIDFNEIPVGTLYPHNRFELKLGLNADLGKRWTGWANVAGAWGQQGFYQYALRLGIKRTW